MGGITVDDFTSSVAYREIFGLGHQQGEQKGEQKGRQTEASALTLRQLQLDALGDAATRLGLRP